MKRRVETASTARTTMVVKIREQKDQGRAEEEQNLLWISLMKRSWKMLIILAIILWMY